MGNAVAGNIFSHAVNLIAAIQKPRNSKNRKKITFPVVIRKETFQPLKTFRNKVSIFFVSTEAQLTMKLKVARID